MSGHNWSGWPGAYCLRCGAEHVLETAIAENWLSFGPGPDGGATPDVWKSEDHKNLVKLCDEHCYADMTPEEQKKHGEVIRLLCVKLGIENSLPEEKPPEPVPRLEGPPPVVREVHGCCDLLDDLLD